MVRSITVIQSLITGILLLGCSRGAGPEAGKISNPAATGSQLPHLYTDEAGNVFLSWIESDTKPDTYQLMYSTLMDETWSKPAMISSSDRWFVNWADYPSMIASNGNPLSAHWLRKKPGSTYSYDVKVARSGSSNTWKPAITPHTDSTATEHGFVSMIPYSDKSVMAIWLDGRKTHNRPEEEYFNLDKAMTLRSAVIDSAGNVSERLLIDESVCDCCQTSLIYTPEGPIAAFRNRTGGEIRDIYVSRFSDGSWSKATPVHKDGWKIGACPVNGPKLAANDSLVAVAWYTGAGNQPRVKAAVSTDFGATFSEPFIVDEGNPIGRVDAVVGTDGTVYISWMERKDKKAQFNVRWFNRDNFSSKTVTITDMDPSRQSGFPQMTLQRDRLLFAWTEIGDSDTTQVQTAELSLPLPL